MKINREIEQVAIGLLCVASAIIIMSLIHPIPIKKDSKTFKNVATSSQQDISGLYSHHTTERQGYVIKNLKIYIELTENNEIFWINKGSPSFKRTGRYDYFDNLITPLWNPGPGSLPTMINVYNEKLEFYINNRKTTMIKVR